MHTDARARAPQRNPIMAYPPYDSLPSALLRADQSRDHRRPAVDLALHETGDLGRIHGSHFDRVLLDLALHLRPLQGLDDLAVGALHDVERKPRRSRERIPGTGEQVAEERLHEDGARARADRADDRAPATAAGKIGCVSTGAREAGEDSTWRAAPRPC